MYDTISQQTETIRTQVEVLKSKLEEAKSRQAMLIARSQMADTQKSLAQAAGGFDVSSASAKFDRMEERLFRKRLRLRLLQISPLTTIIPMKRNLKKLKMHQRLIQSLKDSRLKWDFNL